MILGIDEVGRGPWAGPLVVGAVVLPDECGIEGLTDSKKLSDKKRRELDLLIKEKALGWGLGWVHADELDAVGLPVALRLATKRAVEAVKCSYHEIIIDGTINFLSGTAKGDFAKTMPKADLLIPAVSAASILAKVARDTYMVEQDVFYPGYGFATHVGYGTAKHQAALLAHGVTPLHRASFAPVRRMLSNQGEAPGSKPSSKGAEAESQAASYLEGLGYTILERNWKTKWCEIDIVAENPEVRLYVEVKYRSATRQGDALSAVTAKKLQQMQFAAELYESKYSSDKLSQLAVIAINGKDEPKLLTLQ